MSVPKLALALAVAISLIGCGDSAETPDPPEPEAPDPPAGSLLADPLAPLPERLSETGLFKAAPALDQVSQVAHVFSPGWPLWSDGLSKVRHIVVPEGEAVGTADREAWAFPVGTLLFKTFSDDSGPIETRVLRRAEDAWEFGAYRWRSDGTDADKLDLKKGVLVEATLQGETFEHRIPNLLECRQCHEASPSPVLGFDELRLNHKEPGESESELARMFELGVLGGALPADPVTIVDPDPVAREVRGYLHGNCSNCHNGWTGESSSFDMRHQVALENTIGVPTDSSASAPGIRIVPGSPEASILFLAFSGETEDPEVKAMPPVGVSRRDAAAIELLRGFIAALPAR